MSDDIQEVRTSAQEYAIMLAEMIDFLEKLSAPLSGGFDQAKLEVKSRVDKGMSFPEALYEVSQWILKGKIQ